MALTSRQELIDYSLRRLGFPVIEINVDDDQVSDRIDDAIQFWQEYHFDGSERAYIKRQLTGSTLNIQSGIAGSFTVGETLTGGTSGATTKIVSGAGTSFTVVSTKGTFQGGEVVTGDKSGLTANLASSSPYTAGDIDNGWIPIEDNVLGVTKVFRFGPAFQGINSDGLFDVDYQFALNDMYNLLSADLTYYTQVQTNLSMLNDMFVSDRQIRFNRKTNKLHLDLDWDDTFEVGDYIVVDAMVLVDGAEYAEVYDDMFLKKYSTALIKRQWGENMKKFGGIQLPGGVTLNGDQIFQEAVNEISTIEEEMQLKYELPPSFQVG
ncbi:MAG: hypothetical protein CBB97_11330 [Candidatus Endolissoclinum sp. TMED37]|nr:MAG: hypothetical protein CBB97_11330 [Candidatus Endolissoclinum sp. TMED37]